MTISSLNRQAGPYIGNDVAASFPFDFKVFKPQDLLVTLADAAGTESILTLGASYRVTLNTNQDSNPGGTVTLTSGPLPVGQTLVITSDIPALQETDLTNQGGFYPRVITNSLDKLTILIQQLRAGLGRAVTFPSTWTGSTTIPGGNKSNTVLGFDAAGNLTVLPAQVGGSLVDLDRAVHGAFAAFAGGQDRGDWSPLTPYQAGQIAWAGNVGYQAKSTHTSGATFATDLSAGEWVVFQGITRPELSAAEGAGLVGFKQLGAGAVPRTMLGKARERVSLLDFVPESEHAAIRAGTSTYDCLPAIYKAIDSQSFDNKPYYVAAPKIEVPEGVYYFSGEINPKKTVHLYGSGSGLTGANSVIFKFPAGSNGIIVNRYNTNGATGAVAAGKGADGSIIEGITVMQSGYAAQAAPILDYNAATGQIIANQLGARFAPGDTIYVPDNLINSLGSATVTAVDATTKTLGLSRSPAVFSLGETITGATSGAMATIVYVAAQAMGLGIKAVTGSFVAGETITGTSGATSTVSGYFGPVLAVYTLTGVTGAFNPGGVAIKTTAKGTGFRLRARASLRRCQAIGWPEYGFAAIAGEVGATNANLFAIDECSASGIGIHGLIASGGDANAGGITKFNGVGCGGYGVYDASFLGNHYFSAHVSNCGMGAYYSSRQNNFSVFVGCYSEGMEQTQPFRVPRSTIGRESIVIGGDHGAGFDAPEYMSPAGFANMSGGALRFGLNGIGDRGLDPTGRIVNTFRLLGVGGAPTPVTAGTVGLKQNGYGAYYGVRLPIGNVLSPVKDDGTSTVDGGKFGITWEPYVGSNFKVFTIPSSALAAGNGITVTGGAPSRPAVFWPVITGGVITSLQIVDSGAGYTSAPTISGTGAWAGFSATVDIFNGSVVNPIITNGLTGLDSAAPVLALTANTKFVYPGSDSQCALGMSIYRWSTVYASTSTISTSDARSKQGIRSLDDKERTVALKCKSLLRAFRFKDAVDKKGDGARIHFGAIAQDIKAAFESEGLRAEDYALLCYDKWDAQDEVVGENGEVIQQAVEAGDLYGIRYEELLCFIISAI